MDPKPNRESTMEERTLENDLQTTDMDGTSSSAGDDEEPGQTEPRVPDSSHNFSTLVKNGDCRICYDSAEASGEDPILELGCQCKDELRFGHQSCLTKWFVQQLRRRGTSDCDICRNSLGVYLETIVRNTFRQEVSHARPVRLLLQLREEELDRLQVPFPTPHFGDLPQETRQALEASMDRQEEVALRGGTRQSATLLMAYILAFTSGEVYVSSPLTVNEIQARIREAAEIRDGVLGGTVELVDLFPNGGGLDIDDDDMEFYADLDMTIVQLDAEHLYPLGDELENVLNRVSAAVDGLAANGDVDMLIVDAAIDVLAANGDVDMLIVEFLRFDPRGSRDSTYGRHRVFLLRDIP